MSKTSVVIPVGPEAGHAKYLQEAIDSVVAQTLPPSEILLIDDMHGLSAGVDTSRGVPIRTWRAPWRLGVGAAFNAGIGLAEGDLVLMLCADDWLEPDCLRQCVAAFEEAGSDELAYYYLTVRYDVAALDGNYPYALPEGLVQNLPCGAAMVTKALWQHTGGFPVESTSLAPDAAFCSILMGRGEEAGRLRPVADGVPLYNVRMHPGQDTVGRKAWYTAIIELRHLVTLEWRQPAWGRYS